VGIVKKHTTKTQAQKKDVPLGLTLSTLVISVALAIGAMPETAMAQAATVQINISAQPLHQALLQLGQQTDIQIYYVPETVAGIQVQAISGKYTPRQALDRLLSGTRISYTDNGNGAYTLTTKSGEATLGLITVTTPQDNATEGSGSYTKQVTRSSTGLALTLRETPQSVSVMTRERMEDQSLTNIGDVLRQTPGLVVQNMGSERFTVSARGGEIDSYQIDGVQTLVEVGTQDVSQSLTDMVIYDNVEIVRGATGLLTGAGDPAGALNLIRKRPAKVFQARAGLGVGSWNRYRAEADISTPLNKAGTLRGRFVGAYQQGDSFIDYYSQEKQVFYGIVEADIGEATMLSAGLDYQKTKSKGSLGGLGLPLLYSNGEQMWLPRSRSISSRSSFFNVDALNAFAALEHRFNSDWALKVSVNRLESDRDFLTAMASVTGGFVNKDTGAGLPLWIQVGQSRQEQTGIDARIDGKYTLFGRQHDLVMGVSYAESKTELDSYNDVNGTAAANPFNPYTWDSREIFPVVAKYYDSNTYTKNYGGFIATRLHATDKLSVIGGLRLSNYSWDYEQLYATVPMQQWNQKIYASASGNITPYAGLVYNINDSHSVYASYTSIFKPQTYRDRNGKWLDPREGINYEAGLKSAFFDGKLNTSVAAYYTVQDNLAVQDGSNVVPGTDGNVSAYRAVDKAKTRGVDIELTGELQPNWHVAASYTYAKTEDNTGKQLKTTMPEHLVKLWSTYRLPGAMHKLTIGGGVNWQSEVTHSVSSWRLPSTSQVRQASYTVANLMARYDVTDNVTAILNINNVFDKQYLSSIDTTFNTGYYGAPRNVMLNLNYRFD
jgi:outer membrane receptor for ferric coprogen and ferric-rhodotorulic acid